MTLKLPVKNQKLLEEALTHRSYLNENKEAKIHNERLEFLGDAVLELAVSEYLYTHFPDSNEGELTAYRAAMVKTTSLAETAEELKLGQNLRLSKGEELSGGRENRSLLANTFESIIGAIYLDQGFEKVNQFLETSLFPKIDTIIRLKLFKDYKSSLQELVQADGFTSPEYCVVKESGPDHNKQFTIAVKIGDKVYAEGKGKSKQAAQQEAARAALEKFGDS